MKKQILLFLPVLSVFLLAAQCENNDLTPQLGQAFTVRPEQTVSVTDNLSFTLAKLQDSRCPDGMQCIWAGYADAQVKLTASGASTETTLCLGDCRNGSTEPYKTEDSATVTVGGQAYLITLKAIREPGKPTDATFVVTRK